MYAVPYNCVNGSLKLRLVEPINKADVTIAPPCVQSFKESEENTYHELNDIRVYWCFFSIFFNYIKWISKRYCC